MRSLAICCLLVAAARPLPALAQAPDPQQYRVVSTEAYRVSHPGEHAQQLGFQALLRNRPEEARRQFGFGARYADKLSQFMLGQLYWEGIGGAVDRPLAYAWMDLAAERGDSAALARREVLWAELDSAERDRAIREGHALQGRYADAVAQPRLEAVVRRARKQVTGSRTGWVGKVTICTAEEHKAFTKASPLPCMDSMPGEIYYAGDLWQPAEYWARQDAKMARELSPQVEVGPARALMPSSNKSD